VNDPPGTEDDPADWFRDLLDTTAEPDEDPLDLAVVTYGSLLHPREIDTLFHHEDRIVVPVRVEGFSRHFSKSVAPHLRDVEGEESGVLNVHPNHGEWFNGLLIGPLREKGLRKYAFREREYDVIDLGLSHLELYSESDLDLDDFETVFTCYLDPSDESVDLYEPVPDYLDLCLEGAEKWGGSFLKQFKETTRVGEKTLIDYLP